MLNMRLSSGQLYCPARDILQLYLPVAEEAIKRLAPGRWHAVVRDYAQHHGVTEEDMARGVAALREFIHQCSAFVSTEIAIPWTNSGLAALPNPVLMCLMFQLGVGFTATYYNAVQHSVRAATSPPGADPFGAQADQVMHAMKAPSARTRKKRIDAFKGEKG